MKPLKTAAQISLRTLYWTLFGLWMVGITYASSLSVPPMPPGIEGFVPIDKVCHFAAFALGGLLLALALKRSTDWSLLKIFVVALLAVSAFGVLDELHQLLTPGRSGADLGDWSADSLGAATGACLLLFGYVRLRQNSAAAQTP